MPRNKASRLRLAQPEPEPEPEQESGESGESDSGSDAESVGSAEAYEAQLHELFQRADRNGDGSLKRAGASMPSPCKPLTPQPNWDALPELIVSTGVAPFGQNSSCGCARTRSLQHC